MERLLSSTLKEINSPPEAFNQSLNQIQLKEETPAQLIDPAYPRYDKIVELPPDTPHKKIVPMIPKGITEIPESFTGLKKFIDSPVTASEIPNKKAFMGKVFPWIVNALVDAGYDSQGIDAFLKKSIDTIDFNNPPEKYINDINRILHNIWEQVRAEKSKSPQVVTEASPQPLVLTDQDRVLDKTQTVVTVDVVEERIAKNSLEKETAVDAFQNKFNALIEQPFNSDLYDQFYAEIHAALRDRYDAVLLKAQTNLTRYSNLYTPSPTEKVALQFLSTLKSQFVRTQAADSKLGVTRAEIMDSLSKTDASINEEAVKTFIQDYIDGTKNLFINIDRLEEMITIAQGEEKPRIAEAYRAQFESMRVEGTKVLTTLPSSHPLYNDFKIVVEKGIGDLIDGASVEKGGDRAIGERSSYFISLRNRVQAAIGYVKAEQEFENFKNRQLQQVQNLELSLATSTESLPSEKIVIKNIALSNLTTIKNCLTTAGELPTGVSMSSLSELTLTESTKDFATQKDAVKDMLRATNEILKELQISDENTSEESKSIARLEFSPAYPPQVETILAPLMQRSVQLQTEITESSVNRTRLLNLRSLIKPARMGALALLAVAFGSGQYKPAQNEMGSSSLHNLMGMSVANIPNQATFDRTAIEEFLKFTSITTVEAKVLDLPPVIPEIIPIQSSAPVEVVPGVIFPTTKYSLAPSQEAPELKIFGAADSVPLDPGITFNTPSQSEQGMVYSEKDFHTVVYGDTFWDISEGESLAGSLPVMKQINPYFKQHLIDRMRDRLNADDSMRKKIGGFGKTANDLIINEKVNVNKLNAELLLEAINAGYLQ